MKEDTATTFTTVIFGGPSQIIVTAILICIGLYHCTLSVRSIFGRVTAISAGQHALFLFTIPAVIFMYLCAAAPTAPLIIAGILVSRYPDAQAGLSDALLRVACFGWLGLGVFLVNFLLATVALRRGYAKTA